MCSAAGAIAPFSIERPRSAASRTLALGTLIGTLVLSAPGTGRACTFPVPAPRPDEGDEVPVNTKVWAHAAFGPCELWSQVEPLPTAVAQIGAMQILLPEQDLPKGETFDVVCGGVLASTFDVSLDADSVAPRAPTGRVSREYEQDGSCGEDGMDTAVLEVEPTGEILAMDWCRTATLDAKALTGQAALFQDREPIEVSVEDCTEFRFAAFDLAGNFSDWGEELEVGGCSVAAVAPSPLSPSAAWMAATFAAWMTARRRRSRTQR